MSDLLTWIGPILILLIVWVFGFAGCSSFSSAPMDEVPEEEKPEEEKPPVVVPTPDPVPPPPVVPPTYAEVIAATPGFAALWPLNETGGNVATVIGSLNPGANGVYTVGGGGPAGSGYTLGANGALFGKDTKDFAPEFNGTAAYVEVPFNGQLNPDKTVPGFSIEVWVKPNPAIGGATQVVISSHRFEGANAQLGYEMALIRNAGQQNQQIRARVFANGAMSEAVVQPLQEDAVEWRHIVLIYQTPPTGSPTLTVRARIAGTGNAYADGPHGASYESVISTRSSSLRFGAGHAQGQGPTNFFAGRIDNVAFYNAVLDQTEIDKHFAMF